MTTHAPAMVLASFVGDSLALGAHWIYDTAQIDQQIGRVDRLLRPLPGSYHPNRDQGEFTHYGDQTLVLLESLAADKGFVLEHFGAAWRKLFTNYDGYLDKATKQTLENLTSNPLLTTCGSGSTDLSAAARIAPLAYLFRDDQQQLVASAVAQARMTHNSPASLAAAEFLAKLVFQVLHGVPLAEAVETTLDDGVADLDLDLRLRAGLDLVGQESRAAIARLGQRFGGPGPGRGHDPRRPPGHGRDPRPLAGRSAPAEAYRTVAGTAPLSRDPGQTARWRRSPATPHATLWRGASGGTPA